ncbi:hypothetical protein [Ancylobacter oerskovii]|uniref:Tail protein n=1 Tax=Ancylobacter oerskovii TaxID=459519 RepID=A0ABW4YRN7_9HYPH|nr:hypothetical protein [Ancylobacter oerskovii]MBS7545690.1 hypothetical protein [Ancylobacter oerskovii]
MKRSGRKQSAFTAGELAGSVWERDDFKYFWVGLREAVNVDITPQGGLKVRPGLRHRAQLPMSACRLFGFTASNGAVYDIVARAGAFDIYQGGILQASAVHDYTVGQLADLVVAQQLDTAILTHAAKRTMRLAHFGPTSWVLEAAPLAGIPLYDYGGAYTNGVAAEWDIELIGFREGDPPNNADVIWTLTVNNAETTALRASITSTTVEDADQTAATILAALLDLPNVGPGIQVLVLSASEDRFRVIFTGAENTGDNWAVSGRVVNKADAAVVCSKRTVGVTAGEDVISDVRGWPRCAAFYQQRLLLGGLAGIPNAYLVSRIGDYFNLDQRLDTAAGAFMVPMDTSGGEVIERIVAGRDLLILTSEAEYSISDRELSKTSPPVHVEASRNGARGRAIAENEGAVLFAFSEGGGIGELRWTDVSGNYVTGDLGLLAPHLVRDVVDLAVRGKTGSQQGNRIGLVREDSSLVLGTLLRDQEVTAFSQVASDGQFLAVSCNGRNDLMVLAQRSAGAGALGSLEVFEEGQLLDQATTVTLDPPGTVVGGLTLFEGAEVWAIADGDVLGPFTVAGGSITIGKVASSVTVGRWTPPRISTLPLAREVGPKIVVVGKGRIHSVHLNLEDTTSVAIAVNGGPARDIPLFPIDSIEAGTPELSLGFTGRRSIRNLRGFRDDPYVTITQVRPGRLTLKSIVVEAAL